MENNSDDIWECEICGKTFDTKRECDRHEGECSNRKDKRTCCLSKPKKCILCENDTSSSGTCNSCGLENNLTRRNNENYEFVFKGGEKITLPIEKDFSIEFFAKKHGEKIMDMVKERANERKMASVGYYKGKMCPFTQVEIGGTKAATFAFTGASLNEYVWTHGQCIEEYCAIWDSKNSQCSLMTIAKKLK